MSSTPSRSYEKGPRLSFKKVLVLEIPSDILCRWRHKLQSELFEPIRSPLVVCKYGSNLPQGRNDLGPDMVAILVMEVFKQP